MKRKRYTTSVLAEPTWWPPGRSPVGMQKEMIVGILLNKLEALLDHYSITGGINDPENGWHLALRLAGEHIEGFAAKPQKPSRPAHRPPDPIAGVRDLVLCYEGYRAKAEGRSEREAVRDLADSWRNNGTCALADVTFSWTDDTLWRHYQRLRRQLGDSGLTDGMTLAAMTILGGGGS